MSETEQLDNTTAVAPQIYRFIRQQIVSAKLLPGTSISEKEVAAKYHVSRQPVREAFIRLAAAGLVQVRPQRGTYVSKITEKAVLDARFVREAIEVEIVRQVAEERSPDLVRDLRAQLVEQRAVKLDHPGLFLKLDERFHWTLAKAAVQPYAWAVVEDVKAQMDRVRFLSYNPLHTGRLIEQHEQIADAIADSNPADAELVMRTHLREIVTTLKELMAEQPELFS